MNNADGYQYVKNILSVQEYSKLYSDLLLAQESLKKSFSNFPIQCCSHGVDFLKEIYKLPVSIGIVQIGQHSFGHSWNTDFEKRLIVDITLHQYNNQTIKDIPSVIILPKDQAEQKYGYIDISELLNPSLNPSTNVLLLRSRWNMLTRRINSKPE